MYQVNLLKHELVPTHSIIKNPIEKKKILKDYNINYNQLPIISKNDNIAKLIRINKNDICKIIRSSRTSIKSEYYRICKIVYWIYFI